MLKDRPEGWQKKSLVRFWPLTQSPHSSQDHFSHPAPQSWTHPDASLRNSRRGNWTNFIAVTAQQEGCGLTMEWTGLHHRQRQRLTITHITGFSKLKVSKLKLVVARDVSLSSVATGVENGRKFNCYSVDIPRNSVSSHVSVLLTERGVRWRIPLELVNRELRA